MFYRQPLSLSIHLSVCQPVCSPWAKCVFLYRWHEDYCQWDYVEYCCTVCNCCCPSTCSTFVFLNHIINYKSNIINITNLRVILFTCIFIFIIMFWCMTEIKLAKEEHSNCSIWIALLWSGFGGVLLRIIFCVCVFWLIELRYLTLKQYCNTVNWMWIKEK